MWEGKNRDKKEKNNEEVKMNGKGRKS